MKWIVLEENPKPDNYIAVVRTDSFKKLQLESKAHTAFTDGDLAMKRAKELRELFGVKGIRVFDSESHSTPVRIK